MKQNNTDAAQSPNWETFLVQVLREEVASREAELDALRGSLRYRVGGWALEAFPPGRGTIVFFVRILRLFMRRRPRRASSARSAANYQYQAKAPQQYADVVVYGREVPATYADMDVWQTQDAELIAQRLDGQGNTPGTLVVRQVSQTVLRRIARARRNQWHIVWDPEEASPAPDAAMAAYMQSQADEITTGKAIRS